MISQLVELAKESDLHSHKKGTETTGQQPNRMIALKRS